MSWQHNSAGQRTNAWRDNGTGSGSAYVYDEDGRQTDLMHRAYFGGIDPTFLAAWTYAYDAVGNRRYTRAIIDTDRSERYGHDNLNRLTLMDRGVLNSESTAVETPLSHPVLDSSEQWANLDRRGNWLDYRWANTQGGQSTSQVQTRTANGVNEYVSIDPDGPNGSGEAVSMTYDVAGNLTMDPLAPNVGTAAAGQEYVYDEENRVVEVKRHVDGATLAKYEYDALGRRVHTIECIDPATGAALATPRKTRHVYVGLETAEELDVSSDANGNDVNTIQLREFLWGDSGRFPEPLAMVDWTEAGEQSECIREVVYYLHDVLGSVVGLTNEDGELVERYTYDPYGKTYVETADGQGGWTGGNVSVFGNLFLWTGQRYDAGTGLYAFWFRTYSPSLGRWLQRDPVDYAGGSINLYEYVIGQPLALRDMLGLDPVAVYPKTTMPNDSVARHFEAAAGEYKYSFSADSATGILKGLLNLKAQGVTITELHIFGHGAKEGGGSQWLGIGYRIYPDGTLAQIGSQIEEGGSITMWGCNVAQGEAGEGFLINSALVANRTVQGYTGPVDYIPSYLQWLFGGSHIGRGLLLTMTPAQAQFLLSDRYYRMIVAAGSECSGRYGPAAAGTHYEMDASHNCVSVCNEDTHPPSKW